MVVDYEEFGVADADSREINFTNLEEDENDENVFFII